MMCASLASAAPSDVIYGKDGWLFFVEDKHDTIGRDTVKDIVQAVKLVEKTGTKIIVLVAPEKSRIYADKLPRATELFSRRYSKFINQLQSSGVDAPDFATPLIKARKASPSVNLYHLQDTHWTPDGTLIIVDEIKKDILRRQIDLSDLPTVEYSRTSVQETNLGDLGIRAQNPELKPAPYRKYVYELKVPATDSLLDDTHKIGIALVGTSYSQSFTTLPEALQASLHHEVISVGIGGGGIWQPLSTYLNSDSYKLNPPKLLIWEFPGNHIWVDHLDGWFDKEIVPAVKRLKK